MDEQTELDELKKKRLAALVTSRKAVREHPEAFDELRHLVESILAEKLDISDYHPMADRLCGLLQTLMQSGAGSVFSYFHQNIDPRQGGEVRYFRAICSDLLEQLQAVERFGACEGRRNIRRIK